MGAPRTGSWLVGPSRQQGPLSISHPCSWASQAEAASTRTGNGHRCPGPRGPAQAGPGTCLWPWVSPALVVVVPFSPGGPRMPSVSTWRPSPERLRHFLHRGSKPQIEILFLLPETMASVGIALPGRAPWAPRAELSRALEAALALGVGCS